MKIKFPAASFFIFILVFMLIGIAYSQEKQTVGQKLKSFWQKIFEYPANVTNEAAGVASETITGTTKVVTKEVKTVGQVTSGDLDKTGDLVTGPVVGTVETTTKVVEDAAAIPVKASKEETK